MLRLSSKRSCFNLTKLRRSFSNTVSYDLRSFEKLAHQYPSVGMLSVDGKQFGSCVLVDEQKAITLSHCIPSMWWERNFETSFSNNEKAQVSDVLTHPIYKDKFSKISTVKYDIALIFLKNKITAKKAEMSYQPISAENNCVAVGFPGSFAPNSVDPAQAKKQQLTYGKKLAFKNSCYSDLKFKPVITGTLESKVGYIVDKRNGKFIRTHQPLYQASANPGMSGGGLFKKGKLIGLNQGGFSRTQNGVWTNNFFISLAMHQVWLENALNLKNAVFTEMQNQDARLLKELESLLKTKIDPECHQIEYSSKANCIKIKVPDAERVTCAKLFLENGFVPAYNGKSFNLLASPTLILMNETLETAIHKLSRMPDLILDIERESALAKEYSFS